MGFALLATRLVSAWNVRYSYGVAVTPGVWVGVNFLVTVGVRIGVNVRVGVGVREAVRVNVVVAVGGAVGASPCNKNCPTTFQSSPTNTWTV